MNTSAIPEKSGLHPLIIAAAVAVLLFCGVGIAAVMGWLPSSNSSANTALTSADQMANVPAPLPSQAVNNSQGSQANPPRVQDEPRQAPLEHVAAICSNCGVVESVREVTTRGEGSGVGAAGGAVVGGLLGNQVGSGHGRQLATIAGAIGGAVAGNQIEGSARASHSYDVRVRLNDGNVRTLHQSTPPDWQSGDRVRLVNGQLRANG